MFDWILNTFFVQKDKPFPEAFPIPRGQLREVLAAVLEKSAKRLEESVSVVDTTFQGSVELGEGGGR